MSWKVVVNSAKAVLDMISGCLTYQMMRTRLFVIVLELAHALHYQTQEQNNWSSNNTGLSGLGSSVLLTNGFMMSPKTEHNSEEHMRLVQMLIKTLKWYNTIVISNHVHSEDEDNLQFLLADLRFTSVFDLGDLRHSVGVKSVLQELHMKFTLNLNFLLLSNYSRALQLLQTVDQYDLESNRTTEFRHHSFWVVACYSPCQPETGVLSQVHHLENVVIMVLQKDGSSSLFQLLTTSGGRSFSQVIGPNGISEKDIFLNRRYGLNKRTLTVSTMLYEPYVMKKGDAFEGYLIDVLDSIAFALNFSYSIVQPEDMKWGEIVDGRWDGLVGQLARREVDLVVAALVIHEDREKVMDFVSPPIAMIVNDIMYNVEAEKLERWNIYVRPFSTSIFIILSVTLVASSVMGYVLCICHDFFMRQERNISAKKLGMLTLADTFFSMLGILILRGSKTNPKSQSAKILLFAWGVFSVTIAACYTANLVALFADQKPTLPITSLGELVRQKEYKWGFVGGNIREHIFNRSRSSDMKLAWEGVVQFNKTDPEVLSPDIDVHLAKVKKEKYALITDRYKIKKMKSYDCHINQVGQNILWYQVGIGVSTDYPLKKELENVLSEVVDSGLPDFWWQRWSKIKSDQCIKDRSVKTLTFSEVSSIFCLLCVGLGIAGVVLVIEVHIHKLNYL